MSAPLPTLRRVHVGTDGTRRKDATALTFERWLLHLIRSAMGWSR